MFGLDETELHNTLLKRIKGTPYVFPYISMLNTSKFNPHLKAIHNDQEYPHLLHHLKNASKSLTTKKKLIKEMPSPSPWNISSIFLKIMKLSHFSESPQLLGIFDLELI